MNYKKNYYKLHTNFHEENSKEKSKVINLLLHRKNNLNFKSIIDVACGSGLVLLNIVHNNNFTKAIGIDISKDAINKAIKNDSESKIKWITGDAKNLGKTVFDLVLLIDIIEHIKEDESFLNLLKNKGKFFIIKIPVEKNFLNSFVKFISFGNINLNKTNEKKYGHVQSYNQKSFFKLLKNVGFKIIDIEYMPLPKRSMIGWEILRILFYPFWFMSKKLYLKLNGGFIVAMVKLK